MHNVILNNGVEMPILGFGVFQIPDDETQAAVEAALAAGYRHLDTAASYGNEEAVGRAIVASGIARSDIFVTTKLWIQSNPTQTKARAALVDLIEHNEIAPAVNQIETHPFFQRQIDQDVMRERGVQIESWGPFAEGRNGLFTNPELSEIAAARGKSVAQVVLRWLIQREVVVIPKSVRPERLAENLDVFGFELTADDMSRIATLDTGASVFFDHRDPAMVSWLNGRREA